MVRDVDAVEQLAATMLATVADDDLLASLSDNVARMALHHSAEAIVDQVEKIINHSNEK